jgi:signal transduction histidine kinase
VARLAGTFDLIIADYSLPAFTAVGALLHLQDRGLDIPFIVATGSLEDDQAMECIKRGATDYVLKDRLARLGHAVAQALEEKRKRAERKELEEQLQQAQKMEAVGRLAGGIAHDFNNLLMAINGFADLLLMQPQEERTYANIKQIREAGQRATALTRQLLAFSRKQVLQPIALDLTSVIRGIETMVKQLIGAGVVLKIALRSQKTVKADAGQIEQVIMNMVVNAVDAMPHGGTLTIENSDVQISGDSINHHHEVTPGPYVMLAVRDTGCGMDKATQMHIFEPFFTTKDPGKGTGLGLSMAYGIIKQSGGHICVDSEVGEGTAFNIYLPIVEEPVQKLKPRPPSTELPRGAETVLVVEDEDRVREYLHQLLSSIGYTVLLASDGYKALEMCGQHAGPIHALLTDIVTPRLSGRALTDHLKALYPDMKVIYMSGYTDEGIVQDALKQTDAVFLQKPCSPIDLTQKLREVLDASPQKCSGKSRNS